METVHRERRNFLKSFGLAALWATLFSGKTIASAVAKDADANRKPILKAVPAQGLVEHRSSSRS